MDDNKALFDYWHGRVQLKNHELIKASRHVPTFELRHECTNYEVLTISSNLEELSEECQVEANQLKQDIEMARQISEKASLN